MGSPQRTEAESAREGIATIAQTGAGMAQAISGYLTMIGAAMGARGDQSMALEALVQVEAIAASQEQVLAGLRAELNRLRKLEGGERG